MRFEPSKIQTIVVHRDCPDGIASALILSDACPQASIVELYYDQARTNLPALPGMIFCDMTPPAERAQEFIDAGALVLDHHRTWKHVVELFGENGMFADETEQPGVAGANLAYRLHPVCARFAILSGVRDTWQKTSPYWEEACRTAEFLLFLGLEKAIQLGLYEVIRIIEEQTIGGCGTPLLSDHVWERRQSQVKKAIASAYHTKLFEHTVAIVSTVEGINDVADSMSEDLVVGFEYIPNVSASGSPGLYLAFRSKPPFDCGTIARHLGGGGHTCAAAVRLTQGTSPPYTRIMHALQNALSEVAAARSAPGTF